MDLIWTYHDHHDLNGTNDYQAQMPCDDDMPCFGEHLLCDLSFDATNSHSATLVPEFVANASKNGGTCEVLIAAAESVLPYLSVPTVARMHEIFEHRRNIWREKQQKNGHYVQLGKSIKNLNLSIDFDTLEVAGSPTGHSPTAFARFAPKSMETKIPSPSKLKYTENLLRKLGDVESDAGTPRLDAVSPILNETRRFTHTLPSTRTLTRPGSVDNVAENWCMSLSSPFVGRKTFSGELHVFGCI